MFIDNYLLLSDAQALAASAASTNVIDLGSDRDIGKGEPMALVISVDVAADITTGDETYTFAVQTDDSDAFGSPTTLIQRAIAAALLTAGSRHVIPLPEVNERYLRGNYTLAGTTPSVTITAHLQPMSMIQAHGVYPDGFTIS